jgi:uncharacterized protein YjbI with pentapeptide repeats
MSSEEVFAVIIASRSNGNSTTTQGQTAADAKAPPAALNGANGTNGAKPAAAPLKLVSETLTAEELKRRLSISEGVVSSPVTLERCVVKGADKLDLRDTVFRHGVTFDESDFECDVDFSFCVFERGLSVTASKFGGRADFRGARSKGDFRTPLSCFVGHASFDDLYVEETFSAEGAQFRGGADFNRASFSKGVFFCSALLKNREAVTTKFRREANFNDARFRGPLYFSGAVFRGNAVFDRSHMMSSVFFNCDLLREDADPSQPRHKRHEVDEARLGRLLVNPSRPHYFQTCFDADATFIGARVGSSISFGGARFGSDPAHKADFRRVRIDGTAFFDPLREKKKAIFVPVCFRGKANFWNADIRGAANFEAAEFEGAADFEHAHVGRRAYFRAVLDEGKFKHVQFHGEANFLDTLIEGTAEFDGAEFHGQAIFERFTSHGNAFFRAARVNGNGPAPAGTPPRTTLFHKKARFVGASIKGNAEFGGAEFEDEANFERMEVGGNAYFRPRRESKQGARFAKASFEGANIKGDAEFSGSLFGDAANFAGLTVGGAARFDATYHGDQKHEAEPVKFAGEANFTGASFGTQADFPRAKFEGRADFTGLRSSGILNFEGATFEGQCSFREARLTSIVFDREPRGGPRRYGWIKRVGRFLADTPQPARDRPQFNDWVDLRGCTYDRIRVKLEELVSQMEPTGEEARRAQLEPSRYDRQPYTQMVKALRSIGDDRRADYVYVEQRHLERRNMWRRTRQDFGRGLIWRGLRGTTNYLLDVFFLHVGKYGVQPERLFFISLFFVLAGMQIFSLPGAVRPKNAEREPPAEVAVEGPITPDGQPLLNGQWKLRMPPDKSPDLSYGKALKVSFSQFIPIIEVPSGSMWKPSENKFDLLFWEVPFDVYGTLHRIVGAIVVPLLVAAIAAALYRRLQTTF